MINKIFKKFTIISTLLVISSTAFSWDEGVHYTKFKNPPEVTKNTVIEWFWIGCPHCQSLEPIITEWKNNNKPDDVEFKQIPAGFNRTWQQNAMFVYSLMAIDKFEQEKEFAYDIMTDPTHPLRDESDEEYYKRLGYKKNEVLEAMSQPEFIDKIKTNEYLSIKYRDSMDGVPFIVVNGIYMINTSKVEQKDIPEILNYLLTQPAEGYVKTDINKELNEIFKKQVDNK